ncbi:MaoC family dehydratase [Ampullimonas aquatilis]|uniref:MaoC family dehydratase n=1 Tax=Ampullimonas aquatilis TaxID=1341549 RepID=UPI003C70CCBD
MAQPSTDTTTPKLYLDDLSVGMRYHSAEYAMDKAAIVSFAEQFDPQPFHLNEAAAQASFFDGLAASGWHTAAITMRLLVTSGMPLADGLIGAGGEISWPQPTRPDDILHVESEIVAITPSRSKPNQGMVTVRSETLNQDHQIKQLMIAKLLVFRRPI